MRVVAREFELLCYGAGWRAELRERFPSEAAMEGAAEAARRGGRFSLAEFYAHAYIEDKKGRRTWLRSKLRAEGPLQGWQPRA